jgi:hypothetical protein
MTLLQVQHHITSLTITNRIEGGEQVGAIKEEMRGNVKPIVE